jgi:hypothetical protein
VPVHNEQRVVDRAGQASISATVTAAEDIWVTAARAVVPAVTMPTPVSAATSGMAAATSVPGRAFALVPRPSSLVPRPSSLVLARPCGRASCWAAERYLVGPGTRNARSYYMGRTGFEPMTSSVSVQGRPEFRGPPPRHGRWWWWWRVRWARCVMRLLSPLLSAPIYSDLLGCFRRGLPGGLVLGSFDELAVDSDRSPADELSCDLQSSASRFKAGEV